jgi:hypothetical protein
LERNKCSGCSKLSPEVDSEFTLVSPAVGWRISRTQLTDGSYSIAWRCPECWKRHRESKMTTKVDAAPSTSTKPGPRGDR